LSYNQKGLFFVSLNQVKLHHTVWILTKFIYFFIFCR
jgi:hypothetical protein